MFFSLLLFSHTSFPFLFAPFCPHSMRPEQQCLHTTYLTSTFAAGDGVPDRDRAAKLSKRVWFMRELIQRLKKKARNMTFPQTLTRDTRRELLPKGLEKRRKQEENLDQSEDWPLTTFFQRLRLFSPHQPKYKAYTQTDGRFGAHGCVFYAQNKRKQAA